MKNETSILLDELESGLQCLQADVLRSDYNSIESRMAKTSSLAEKLLEQEPDGAAVKQRISSLLIIYKKIILTLETHKHQVSGQLTKIAAARKTVVIYGANNNSF